MMVLLFLLIVPPVVSENLFNGISGMVHLRDDIHIVLHQKNEYQVSMYDAKTDTQIRQGIPRGQGPGESMAITAFGRDPQTGHFYFADQAGFLFITDSTFTVLRQHQIGRHSLHSLLVDRDHIYVGIFSFTGLDLNGDVKVGVVLDKKTLTILNELSIPVKALQFADVPNIELVGNSFTIKSQFMMIDGNRWLMMNSFPFAFRLDAQNRIVETRRFSDQQSVEVMQRFGRWGLRLAAICLSFQYRDGYLYCWNGNKHQNVPLGVYALNMKDPSQAPIHTWVDTDVEIDGSVMASMGATTLITTEVSVIFASGGEFIYRFRNPVFVEK
jgi:hypothetical protein